MWFFGASTSFYGRAESWAGFWDRLNEYSKSFQGVKLRPALCSGVKRCQSSRKALFQAKNYVCYTKQPYVMGENIFAFGFQFDGLVL